MQRWPDKKESKTEIAYIMINCEDGSEVQVMEGLSSLDEVKEILCTFGSYDIVAKIETSSVESLREVITFKIRQMGKIRATTTLVCTETVVPLLRH